MTAPPFHLALPVHDLTAARTFYGEVLGCSEGRSSKTWVDFDFFGHQLVTHLATRTPETDNQVDGRRVPVPHFGVVLSWDVWPELRDRIRDRGTPFLVEPHVRFEGQPGEQATFFVKDPSGNALEFKSFRDPAALFRK